MVPAKDTWYRHRPDHLTSLIIFSYLNVLPGEDDLVGRLAEQPDVAPPRVEVGRVRLHVAVAAVPDAVRVEHELVGRKKGKRLAE